MAINVNYDTIKNTSGLTIDRLWELIKILAYYLLLFFMTVVAVDLYAHLGRSVIALAVVCTVLSCLISYWLVPTERPNQIIAVKRNLLLYLGAMIGGYIIIQNMNKIDSAQLGVSLGLNAGQTQTNAAQGWITMMLQFLMIGTPIGFVGYEFQRIWSFYGFGNGKTTKRKRAEQLQKIIVK